MLTRALPGVGQRARLSAAALSPVALAGCNPVQSALHPAGTDAADVAALFWAMAFGAGAIWLIVMGIAVYAILGRRRPKSERFADRFVFFGGVVFPSVTLAVLLVFGLSLLPDWTADDPPGLRIHVSAEQFWWRVSYEMPDGSRTETANEVHLPAGAVAEFVLTSPDVIHSLWIPPLGGKMDAIPGRTNVLRLTPTVPGIYRGVCAEFCGLSHALMAFAVQVHPPDEFSAWLAREAAPAVADAAPFRAAGCAACHTIRGVTETGGTGPDLTHVASRLSLAAGSLPPGEAALRQWLTAADDVKPGVHMPNYAMLPAAERDALVALLLELR